ncbi:MAG: hypothetical protein EBQ95_01925 [Gammaproteobacteria bacterium]|nr:hypothetical protein [Gammaproteobacteria bacterium]
MEKFVKILLEGIRNSIEKKHRYPWIGLDCNHQLKMVFEPGTAVQLFKDLEQGLIKFSGKNGWDKDSVFSKDETQPYKSYTLHVAPEELHNLLLEQSHSYREQDSLLSILDANRSMTKPDIICLGPFDPELKQFCYGKSNILDMLIIQLNHYFSNSPHDPNLILPFIQKHIGYSESEPFNIHQFHPHCQIVPISEDARFIYAKNTGLTFDDLDKLVSLEIPLQSFIFSYLEFLTEHLESLEKEYLTFAAHHAPSERLNYLHSELHLYEQYIHQSQQNVELKGIQKTENEIEPCLNHIGLFFACYKIMRERLHDVIAELPYLSNITKDKREELLGLYSKIMNGDGNALLALKNLQSNLFEQKTKLTTQIQNIQKHLLLPIVEHLHSAHTGRSLFPIPLHAENYDQQRIKIAVQSPTEIPRLIEEIQKEINGVSLAFKEKQQTQLTQIEIIKTQVEKLKGLLKPSSSQLSLKY